MRQVLIKKIEELSKEARSLVDQRERLLATVQEIEVRLHQISGAISEFDNLLKEEGKNEIGQDSDSRVSESSTGAAEATASN